MMAKIRFFSKNEKNSKQKNRIDKKNTSQDQHLIYQIT